MARHMIKSFSDGHWLGDFAYNNQPQYLGFGDVDGRVCLKNTGVSTAYTGVGVTFTARDDVTATFMAKPNYNAQYGMTLAQSNNTFIGSFKIGNDMGVSRMCNSVNAYVFGSWYDPDYTVGYNVPNDTWNHYEVQYKKGSGSNAIYKVWINGILVINITNGNGTAQVGRLYIGYYSESYTMVDNVRDLIIELSDTRINLTKVAPLKPNAAGNSAQWTVYTSGTDYEKIDDQPYDPADGLYVNSNDQLHLVGVENMPSAASSVKGVHVHAVCAKMSAPTPGNIKAACRTESTDYVGDSVAAKHEGVVVSKLWENNPNTSAAWTVSQVNSMEVGIKSAA